MGRKSNRKKAARALQPEREAADKRQEKITILVLCAVAILNVWAIHLFDKTFIYNKTQFFIVLLGAVLGSLVLLYLWRHKNNSFIITLLYGSLLGAPITYCFVAITNYYFRDNKTQRVQLDILKAGNHPKKRGNCRTPYVVVEYENMSREIKFNCDYERTISKYKSVTLTVSKGFWGYTVYENKLLKE